MDLDEHNDLSDVLHAASKGKVLLSAGHKSSYWNSRTRPLESLADIGASAIVNPKKYNVIVELFPKTTTIADEIVKGILNAQP